MVKRAVRFLLEKPFFAGRIVKAALHIHNLSYHLSGQYSQRLEPDGLHPKHRLMKYHDWFKARVKPQWHVLDVGCGNGAFAFDLKDACSRVTAIDINGDNIAKARKQFAKEGITYICGDATTYRFEEAFDAIVLSNVLEHIEDRVGFLKSLYAPYNLSPPTLLLRVPLLTRDWITLYKKEQGVEWRLDATHFTEYTTESLLDELRRADLLVESQTIQFGEFYGVVKRSALI